MIPLAAPHVTPIATGCRPGDPRFPAGGVAHYDANESDSDESVLLDGCGSGSSVAATTFRSGDGTSGAYRSWTRSFSARIRKSRYLEHLS